MRQAGLRLVGEEFEGTTNGGKVMTSLQLDAWNKPFLSADKMNLPPRIEFPRKNWRVGLSINL